MKHLYKSPIGELVVEIAGDAVVGVRFCDEEMGEMGRFSVSPAFQWLYIYFNEHRNPGFVPAMRLEGTAFQKTVWDVVSRIPYGETRSYGEVAAEVARIMGKPRMSAQAVGTAVGNNPIAIIIPCHRVIPTNGGIGQYAAGSEIKKALLEWER